jgi:hypothetical protein
MCKEVQCPDPQIKAIQHGIAGKENADEQKPYGIEI